MARTVVQKANPNLHGWVKLVHDNEAGDWYVREEGMDAADAPSFDVFDDAEAFYKARVAELHNTPNHEAQARYDAEWGTDNGYAPWQLNREF